jgi:hypothetical protein
MAIEAVRHQKIAETVGLPSVLAISLNGRSRFLNHGD